LGYEKAFCFEPSDIAGMFSLCMADFLLAHVGVLVPENVSANSSFQ